MGSFTAQQISSLRLLAASEINNGHTEAWNYLIKNRKNKQYEPVFTAHLCLSLSRLASKWRSQLQLVHPNSKLSITSVFTHQKPYVTYGPTLETTCEFADVMLVMIDRSDPANIVSKSLFIQAKRADKVSVKLSGNRDLAQLYLYKQKPQFDVTRRFAPKNITFPVITPDNGLNYGITPPDDIVQATLPAHWGANRWMMACGNAQLIGTTVNASTPIQELLVDFLDGSAGIDFKLCNPKETWEDLVKAKDKWSAFVNYILNDSLNCTVQSYVSKFWPFRSHGEDNLFFSLQDLNGLPTISFNADYFLPSSSQHYSHQVLNSIKKLSDNEPPENPPPGIAQGDGDQQWGGMSVVVMEKSIERG